MVKRKGNENDIFLNKKHPKKALPSTSESNSHQNGIFEKMMLKAGYSVGYGDNSNELEVDQSVFQRNLSKLVKAHENYPEVVGELVDGIQKYLEDKKRLEHSLMPTATSATCKSARDVCQDSLIHLLLGIEVLQEKLAYFLLEKMVEISIDERDVVFDQKHGKSLPCMILSQFRWLNKLVNSEVLSDQMLDLIKATPHDVQVEIIALLPDIISDSDHSKVACGLSEILLDYQDLSVAILEALSNLNIKADALSQVRKQVLRTLSSVNVQDLPVVVKFVLQNLGSNETHETIDELRKQLDLTSSFNPVTTSTPCCKSVKISSVKSVELLIMDAIKLALKFQRSVCDSWIKVIESAKSPGQHKSLDFLVLLIIHSLGACKRNVETSLRNKVKCGDFNEDLLHVTFRFHTEILKEYLTTLMILSEILLRSYEPVVSLYGGLIYQKSFISFESFNKQEIIGNLVTHVGNGSQHEVNAALDTLVTLVQLNPEKMAPFGCFVKNIMDHLDSLTLGQIRKVYCMLSLLAYRGGQGGSMLKDDMFIIIRKQLTNSNCRYQKMGVLGALMAAKAASFRSDENESATSSSSSCLQGSQSSKDIGHQQAVSLLKLVFKSTVNSPEALALFCDELFRIIHKRQLDKTVEEWISEKILNDFQEYYIMDINPELIEQLDDGVEVKYGLDELQTESVAINIYKLLKKNERDTAMNQKHASEKLKAPLTLSPFLRLLRICEQYQHGSSLDSIDSLLGCCVALPILQESTFSSLSIKEKHFTLDTMFCLVNWFREVLNAFAPVEDSDIRIKVCQRLKLVVQLQKDIMKYLQDTPNYSPPQAVFDCEDVDKDQIKFFEHSKLAPKKSKAAKKPKSKTKRNKKNLSTQTNQIVTDDEHDANKSVSTGTGCDKNQVSKSTNPFDSNENVLQPFLREIDMEVFVLLQLKINLKSSINVVSSEESLLLSPSEMKFLLEDFADKLHYCLVSSSVIIKLRGFQKPKIIGFSNLELNTPAEVAAFTIHILPSFCQLLEDCSSYFQHATSECDSDVINFQNILSEESQIVSSCMQLVCQSLSSLFEWKGLASGKYHPLLKKSVQTLASRLDKLSERMSIEELIEQSILYLSKFRDTVCSLLGATTLVKLIDALSRYSKHENQKRVVSTVSEYFLRQNWEEIINKKLKLSKINDQIHLLLDAYISNSDSVMGTLEHLSTVAIPQLVERENVSKEDSYNTLNKETFSCYYKILLNYLVESMKTYYSCNPCDLNEELIQWTVAIKIFQILVNLIKVFDEKSNLNTCLKHSRHFVDIFLHHGMPMLDKLFLTHRSESQSLLKNLQMSTRFLQHVCSHSKVLKDIILTNSVPFLKKTLESLVYRVKGMLAVNNCTEAFWLGNLKNRDLKGEEILSQTTNASDHESHESDKDTDKEGRNLSKSSDCDGSDSSEEI